MKLRVKSTGFRQRAWDELRKQEWESAHDLALHIGCSDSGLRAYIRGLETHGLLNRGADGRLVLVRDSGPRAPSYNVNTNELRDWNVEPSMPAHQVSLAIERSGLSHAKWLESHGLHPNNVTRLRHMLNGQRPVSDGIAAAVRRQG